MKADEVDLDVLEEAYRRKNAKKEIVNNVQAVNQL